MNHSSTPWRITKKKLSSPLIFTSFLNFFGESPKSISENSLSPFEFHLHRAFKHHLPLHLLNHFSEPPFSTFPYSLVITIHLHAITATHLHYQESLISNFIFLLSQPPLTHSSSNLCHSSTSPSANQRSIATLIHESVTHVKHRENVTSRRRSSWKCYMQRSRITFGFIGEYRRLKNWR